MGYAANLKWDPKQRRQILITTAKLTWVLMSTGGGQKKETIYKEKGKIGARAPGGYRLRSQRYQYL